MGDENHANIQLRDCGLSKNTSRQLPYIDIHTWINTQFITEWISISVLNHTEDLMVN